MGKFGEPVSVKVRKDGGKIQAIVRRVTFTPEGKVDFKEMLRTDGRWDEVPPSRAIPEECFLYVDPMDFVDTGNKSKGA